MRSRTRPAIKNNMIMLIIMGDSVNSQRRRDGMESEALESICLRLPRGRYMSQSVCALVVAGAELDVSSRTTDPVKRLPGPNADPKCNEMSCLFV